MSRYKKLKFLNFKTDLGMLFLPNDARIRFTSHLMWFLLTFSCNDLENVSIQRLLLW